MSSESFSGKTYIVTGSASGMGLATARHLAAGGANLSLWDINIAALEKAAKELSSQGSNLITFAAVDVTNIENVRQGLTEAKSHFGRVHGIANFAGTGGHQLGVEPVWETKPEEFDFIVGLNVKGLYNLLAESLKPGYLEEPSSFVHIASMFATRGYKNGAIFSASKHAAVGMVKSAALETASRNIRVNIVLPGPIETPMFHQVRSNAGLSESASGTPIPRPGKPEEVAHVTSLLLSDDSSYVTGSSWNVDGGANA